uniref:Uncharacterized protein n=1 Tax=Meloidogyne enterolobii TaxID=390850 RepID=A0A6V7XYL6_MELEN|nr:unnamed protein product [Meloidogyne enterolobii]
MLYCLKKQSKSDTKSNCFMLDWPRGRSSKKRKKLKSLLDKREKTLSLKGIACHLLEPIPYRINTKINKEDITEEKREENFICKRFF